MIRGNGKLLTVEQSQRLSASGKFRRRNKFNAKKCVIDGIKFDSLLEGEHYQELKLLRLAGKIVGAILVHQCHALYVEDKLIGHYESDFDYYDDERQFHVVDCKGQMTPFSKWKIKHYEAQTGRKVEIVTKARKR